MAARPCMSDEIKKQIKAQIFQASVPAGGAVTWSSKRPKAEGQDDRGRSDDR